MIEDLDRGIKKAKVSRAAETLSDEQHLKSIEEHKKVLHSMFGVVDVGVLDEVEGSDVQNRVDFGGVRTVVQMRRRLGSHMHKSYISRKSD